MRGPDLLRAVIESGLTEQKERRESAIRAFMSHQFTQDEEVRFRQVDLQRNLLDLFIRFRKLKTPTFRPGMKAPG